MKRVLMVTPHFPPDTSAAAHRVRLLAPHLPSFGWNPTILTVDPRDYQGRLDPDLLSLVPETLPIVRVRAWQIGWTRRVGFGDLGLRAFVSLLRATRGLLQTGFDCLYVTIFPAYPAMIGPWVKRSMDVPFVLDYQDPWVGAWGLTTGPRKDRKPDSRSRLSRSLSTRLEPIAVTAADALTAVSRGTYESVRERIAAARDKPCEEIPLGGERADFERLRERPRVNPFFDPSDGKIHLSYVGTLLPLGIEILRAFFKALELLKQRNPGVYESVRVHFIGTSNQTIPPVECRALPEAERLGVRDIVREEPLRVDYLDALNVLCQSSAILLLGSSESHYTASKLYPALLAERPVLAVFHEKSSVVSMLEDTARPPAARVVTYGDERRAESRVEELFSALRDLLSRPRYDATSVDLDRLEDLSARAMAGRLAKTLERVSVKSCP